MVVAVAAVVAIAVTAGAAAPAIAGGAATVAGSSAATGAGVAATGAAVGGAAAGGAAAGGAAVGGAAVGGAAVGGAAVGGVAAIEGATITATVAGPGGWAVAASMTTGPFAILVLGATGAEASSGYTFDCWKPILHDASCEPSKGMLLKDVIMDPRIKKVTATTNDNKADPPHLVLQNIWDEEFLIEYVHLACESLLAAHAVKI